MLMSICAIKGYFIEQKIKIYINSHIQCKSLIEIVVKWQTSYLFFTFIRIWIPNMIRLIYNFNALCNIIICHLILNNK